jgi:hypothetical protein
MTTEILQKLPDKFTNYCDVYYQGNEWKLLGMTEDCSILLCRVDHNHPFRQIELEEVWYQDWGEIFLK